MDQLTSRWICSRETYVSVLRLFLLALPAVFNPPPHYPSSIYKNIIDLCTACNVTIITHILPTLFLCIVGRIWETSQHSHHSIFLVAFLISRILFFITKPSETSARPEVSQVNQTLTWSFNQPNITYFSTLAASRQDGSSISLDDMPSHVERTEAQGS